VTYKGAMAGQYYADLLVAKAVIVEIKCSDRLAPEHTAQCLNYLRVSGCHLRLLLNFQWPSLEWKRIVRDFPADPAYTFSTPAASNDL
jgi:GxxExxY protein